MSTWIKKAVERVGDLNLNRIEIRRLANDTVANDTVANDTVAQLERAAANFEDGMDWNTNGAILFVVYVLIYYPDNTTNNTICWMDLFRYGHA